VADSQHASLPLGSFLVRGGGVLRILNSVGVWRCSSRILMVSVALDLPAWTLVITVCHSFYGIRLRVLDSVRIW
jgi:hypothetical protein